MSRVSASCRKCEPRYGFRHPPTYPPPPRNATQCNVVQCTASMLVKRTRTQATIDLLSSAVCTRMRTNVAHDLALSMRCVSPAAALSFFVVLRMACVRACVRTCVRACVRVCLRRYRSSTLRLATRRSKTKRCTTGTFWRTRQNRGRRYCTCCCAVLRVLFAACVRACVRVPCAC